MSFVNIIENKRYGRELTDEEIKIFVKGVTDGSIPDYQISALLMAIVLNGMSDREMTTLTLEMADSGERADLSFCEGIPVDKHSTGGVGDKVTPLLLPLLATFGVTSVKLSGRGLGADPLHARRSRAAQSSDRDPGQHKCAETYAAR